MGDRRARPGGAETLIYDSPITRGLFDPTAGKYRAADAFATLMATAVRDVAALDRSRGATGWS